MKNEELMLRYKEINAASVKRDNEDLALITQKIIKLSNYLNNLPDLRLCKMEVPTYTIGEYNRGQNIKILIAHVTENNQPQLSQETTSRFLQIATEVNNFGIVTEFKSGFRLEKFEETFPMLQLSVYLDLKPIGMTLFDLIKENKPCKLTHPIVGDVNWKYINGCFQLVWDHGPEQDRSLVVDESVMLDNRWERR